MRGSKPQQTHAFPNHLPSPTWHTHTERHHISPWCALSLVVTGNKPNLLGYRYVPLGLCLEVIDKLKCLALRHRFLPYCFFVHLDLPWLRTCFSAWLLRTAVCQDGRERFGFAEVEPVLVCFCRKTFLGYKDFAMFWGPAVQHVEQWMDWWMFLILPCVCPLSPSSILVNLLRGK